MNPEELIAVARGERAAELLLINARIVNTFIGEIEEGNVAIHQGHIAGVGDYHDGKTVIDVDGRYLAPGLINAHIHLESSLLHPSQYARAVVPRGTTAVITDLHEIANVSGLKGMRFVIDCARRLPLDVYLMAPSCVPATTFETSGAALGVDELRAAARWKETIGLGEMMNFPGVLHRDPEVMRKLEAFSGRMIDGHAPHMRGRDLNAYLAAGIRSDHECTTLEEAREKLKRGMHIMIRDGSSEKNLDDLIGIVTDKTFKRCLFVVDDRTCSDLLRQGDIDAVVRKAIAHGLDPVRAIQLATINPAQYFRIPRVGVVAPGCLANVIVINDLEQLQVDMVFYHGKLVARHGWPLFSPKVDIDPELAHSVKIKPFPIEALRIPAPAKPVIEIVPGQIVTRRAEDLPEVVGDCVVADAGRDLLKLAVVERHRATGNIGLGMVKGLGLKRGALASTIAHDSHNVVVAGTSDEDMYLAVKEIERLQGGLVVAAGGKVLGSLALPVAGLLSGEPLEIVVERLEELEEMARDLGCTLPSPFATISFLALPVIPELRLTDKGLIDVTKFEFVK